jgi:predicted ATP-grasp superfamily ATP-dependent carboligase
MEVVRPLALAGIPCAAVIDPNDPTAWSRQTTTILRWDWSNAATGRQDELAKYLIRFAHSQRRRPVLFYDTDDALLFVSRQRATLAEVFDFVVADPEQVETMVDKVRFWALAERLSLPVPFCQTFLAGPGAPPPDLSRLGYPVILKPHRRDPGWESLGPAKALCIDSQEALATSWPRLCDLGQTIVAQRYVEGPESRVESYHVYVDDQGEIAGEFSGRKIRTFPAEQGHTTALTLTGAGDVMRLGRDLVRMLNLRGVAKFDFKRSLDGRLHLLEVNLRFSLWHHPGARAGVNIPALVYADMTGHPRPEVTEASPVRWCRTRDLFAARESGIPFLRWLPWALSCEAKAYWAWNDPMPLIKSAMSRASRGAFSLTAPP